MAIFVVGKVLKVCKMPIDSFIFLIAKPPGHWSQRRLPQRFTNDRQPLHTVQKSMFFSWTRLKILFQCITARNSLSTLSKVGQINFGHFNFRHFDNIYFDFGYFNFKHFEIRHFNIGHLDCLWTFCLWTFCLWKFCLWTFCLWTFCIWTFCLWTFVFGHFVFGHFVLGHFDLEHFDFVQSEFRHFDFRRFDFRHTGHCEFRFSKHQKLKSEKNCRLQTVWHRKEMVCRLLS